jgi:transposase-like protein
MPKFRVPYPPEFRRQMVELVRSGRTPEELARKFEPCGAIDPELDTRGRA